ncbi:NUDIX domain-containing protein [uncultured Clostridium sp.]|uniref:NUDIX hydrolase n=1 Tax=uncultured Clostridium sp. TaxID=59620 RepID=UPI00280AA449|nr:NUDIX domain-containing protein [uncultured Clostridium sp.]
MLFNKLFQIDKVSERIGNINYREAVRAIIIKDKKILMVHSKNKDYKFPGGGIKKGEGRIEALKREIEEETGYVAKTIGKQIGIVTEKSKDKYVHYRIFKMISYYYIAEITGEVKKQRLDAYEAKLEFRPVWIDVKEAIDNNKRIIESKDEIKANWIERETYVLEEIYAGLIR